MRPRRVARGADVAERLTGGHDLRGRHHRRALLAVGEEVVVAVGALLDDVVAGGAGLIVGERDRPCDRGDDRRALGSQDVLALMRIALARRAERVAVGVRAADREDVARGIGHRRGRGRGRAHGERRAARRAGLPRQHGAAQSAHVQQHPVAPGRKRRPLRPGGDHAPADRDPPEVDARDRAGLGLGHEDDPGPHGVGARLVDAQRELGQRGGHHVARAHPEVARHRPRRVRPHERRAVLGAAFDGGAGSPARLGGGGCGEGGEHDGHPGRPADEREHPAWHTGKVGRPARA